MSLAPGCLSIPMNETFHTIIGLATGTFPAPRMRKGSPNALFVGCHRALTTSILRARRRL